jgi:hypothetical protein
MTAHWDQVGGEHDIAALNELGTWWGGPPPAAAAAAAAGAVALGQWTAVHRLTLNGDGNSTPSPAHPLLHALTEVAKTCQHSF